MGVLHVYCCVTMVAKSMEAAQREEWTDRGREGGRATDHTMVAKSIGSAPRAEWREGWTEGGRATDLPVVAKSMGAAPREEWREGGREGGRVTDLTVVAKVYVSCTQGGMEQPISSFITTCRRSVPLISSFL